MRRNKYHVAFLRTDEEGHETILHEWIWSTNPNQARHNAAKKIRRDHVQKIKLKVIKVENTISC